MFNSAFYFHFLVWVDDYILFYMGGIAMGCFLFVWSFIIVILENERVSSLTLSLSGTFGGDAPPASYFFVRYYKTNKTGYFWLCRKGKMTWMVNAALVWASHSYLTKGIKPTADSKTLSFSVQLHRVRVSIWPGWSCLFLGRHALLSPSLARIWIWKSCCSIVEGAA